MRDWRQSGFTEYRGEFGLVYYKGHCKACEKAGDIEVVGYTKPRKRLTRLKRITGESQE